MLVKFGTCGWILVNVGEFGWIWVNLGQSLLSLLNLGNPCDFIAFEVFLGCPRLLFVRLSILGYCKLL